MKKKKEEIPSKAQIMEMVRAMTPEQLIELKAKMIIAYKEGKLSSLPEGFLKEKNEN